MLMLAAPPGPRERAAVVVLGDDAPGAGALGREIEAALASESTFDVLPASRIAGAVSKNAPPEALAEDVAQRARIATAFGTVERAYGEGKTEDALARLAEISALLDAEAAPHAADRVRLDLWRAVIFLLQDRADAAKTWAADALVAAPDLQVDRKAFPPDVDALVAKLRGTKTPAAKIT